MATKKHPAVNQAAGSGEIRHRGKADSFTGILRGGATPHSTPYTSARGGSKLSGTVKRSVTFSSDVDERAHELVGDRGFSSFVNEATRAALNLMATSQIVQEYEAKHGVITEEEMAKARTMLKKARSGRK